MNLHLSYLFPFFLLIEVFIPIFLKLSSIFLQIGKGLLFIMHGDSYCTADVIPVDTATNAMIAVAWYTANDK